MQQQRYAIGLGSNRRHGRYGAPAAVVRAAIAVIADTGADVIVVSPVIATPALGPAGRSFANAAMVVETALAPPALLTLLKSIEARFGRRRGRRWGPRVLDLDILLWSGGCWHAPGGRNLIIPHRGLEVRDFVLRPLSRIAPLWRVGAGVRTVRQAHARLSAPRLTVRATTNREAASVGPVAQLVEQRTFNL